MRSLQFKSFLEDVTRSPSLSSPVFIFTTLILILLLLSVLNNVALDKLSMMEKLSKYRREREREREAREPICISGGWELFHFFQIIVSTEKDV